tara:strand:- start:70 stop:771 length:702 start_codon:yes stop_codon:yes gene_type:complete
MHGDGKGCGCGCPFVLTRGPDANSKLQISGKSGTGKSHHLVQLLLHPKSPWKKGDITILCSALSCDQPVYQKLKKEYTGKIRILEGVPDKQGQEQLIELFKKNKTAKIPQIVVFDDLFVSTKSGPANKFLQDLSVAGRHLDLGMANLVQSPFHDKLSRSMADILIMFESPSSMDQVKTLARQIDAENGGKRLLRAYKDATSERHGALIVDLRPAAGIARFRKSWDDCYDFSVV